MAVVMATIRKQKFNTRRGVNKKLICFLVVVLTISTCLLISTLSLTRTNTGDDGGGGGGGKGYVKKDLSVYPTSGIAISVIIPVYNVRPYIEKCLESLIHQTLPENLMEFIFVDDMSTDGSYEILEQYAAKDIRIRLLKNDKNIGSGESRNFGMSIAQGEYIGFMDSDDSIENTFYEKLYQKAKAGNYDIVKGTSYSVNSSGMFESIYNKVITRRLELKRKIFEAFHYQHQTAIYKKSIYDEHSDIIHFGNYSNAQDCMFLLSYGMYAKSLGIQNDAKYYYLVRDDSASHNLNERFYRGNLLSMNDRLDFLESHMKLGSYNSYLKVYRKTMIERRETLLNSSITDTRIINEINDDFNNTIKRITTLLKKGKRRKNQQV